MAVWLPVDFHQRLFYSGEFLLHLFGFQFSLLKTYTHVRMLLSVQHVLHPIPTSTTVVYIELEMVSRPIILGKLRS